MAATALGQAALGFGEIRSAGRSLTTPHAMSRAVADPAEDTSHSPGPAQVAPQSTHAAVLWSYAMTVGRFLTTAVVTLVMAQFLEPREYGVMALAMVWVTLAQTLALHGPAQAVIQRADVTDRHFDAAFWVTVGGAVLLAGTFAAAAPFWAVVNGASDLVYVCWALAPAILINAFVVVPDAILRRQMQFKKLSIRVLIAGIVSGVAGIAVAVTGFGVWALVVQQLLLTGISAVAISAIAGWRPRLGSIRSVGSAVRDIRRFSLHSISECLAYFGSTRTDALILGAFFGPVAIGLYRFAIRITDTVNEVATSGLGQVSLPHLSRFHADPAAFAARLGKIVHAGALLSLPFFGILAPVAGHLLALIGPQWTDATPALRALCVAGMATSIGAMFAPALQAVGRPGMSAALGWVKAAVSAVVMVGVGIKFSSAEAGTQVLAIAVTFGALHVAFIVVAIIIIFRSVLRVAMSPVLLPALPSLLSALAAASAGWAMQPLLYGVPALVALTVTGTVASLAAGGLLLALDGDVASMAKRLARRVIGAKTVDGPGPVG